MAINIGIFFLIWRSRVEMKKKLAGLFLCIKVIEYNERKHLLFTFANDLFGCSLLSSLELAGASNRTE